MLIAELVPVLLLGQEQVYHHSTIAEETKIVSVKEKEKLKYLKFKKKNSMESKVKVLITLKIHMHDIKSCNKNSRIWILHKYQYKQNSTGKATIK